MTRKNVAKTLTTGVNLKKDVTQTKTISVNNAMTKRFALISASTKTTFAVKRMD